MLTLSTEDGYVKTSEWIGMGKERIFVETWDLQSLKDVKWHHRSKTGDNHYCNSASTSGIGWENLKQNKTKQKKQGPDPIAPCMLCQRSWNLAILWWKSLKLWVGQHAHIREATLWAKKRRTQQNIGATSLTERHIARLTFFLFLFFLSFMTLSFHPRPLHIPHPQSWVNHHASVVL